jgi:seryl-tRNA synthetase
MNADLTVAGGLATLGPELVELRTQLDRRFVAWAHDCGAAAWLFPPLLSVSDLDGMDYFDSFPHLGLVVGSIDETKLASYARDEAISVIPGSDLCGCQHVLPSAACYPAYFHLRGRKLDGPKRITTVATCFRNEVEYRGLQRLRSFTMREIICIGPAEAVTTHLKMFRERIEAFCASLGLGVEIKVATDPFFRKDDPRVAMQRLFPVKEEFVYGGNVAFASLNYHRNFFGERCAISIGDGSPAFTGCVAFGIERWLHAMLDRFETPTAATAALLDIA